MPWSPLDGAEKSDKNWLLAKVDRHVVITIAPRQYVLSTRGFLSTLIAAGLDFLSFFSFFFISCIYYLLIINVELLVEFFYFYFFCGYLHLEVLVVVVGWLWITNYASLSRPREEASRVLWSLTNMDSSFCWLWDYNYDVY